MKDDFFFKSGFVADVSNDISYNDVIKTNSEYRTQYPHLMQQEGNHSDIHTQYTYKYIQTANLVLACGILGVLLYKKI